jgi:tripartite-type tricarboxylate transporter receptor subunit TctC
MGRNVCAGRAAAAAIVVLSMMLAGFASARAETPQEFYKGKLVRLVNGGAAGSGYDLYSRMLAPWFEQKLGAKVIVEARPGAGMMTAMNHVWTQPPDGLTLMLAPGEGALLGQLAGNTGIRFRLSEFPILARVNTAPRLLIIHPKLPYRTMADIVGSGRPFQFGANGKTDGTADTAVFVCHALNIPCKITIGYKSSVDFALAAVRGEVDGTILVEDSSERYAQGDQLRAIATMSRETSKLFPGVPSIFEALPLTKEQQEWLDFRDDIRKIGRLLIVPPGMDAEKLAFLRRIARDVLTDPQALESFEKIKQPALYGPPEAIGEIIGRYAVEKISPERRKQIEFIIMEKYY